MLISMVVVFGTCWLPLQTINFIADLNLVDIFCWEYHHFSECTIEIRLNKYDDNNRALPGTILLEISLRLRILLPSANLMLMNFRVHAGRSIWIFLRKC